MPTRRLLYLSSQQLVACRWQSGALFDEGRFAAGSEGWQRFAEYLAAHADSEFALLVNVAEEGFHIETIPYLQGSDRRALIQRKLGQIYFSAALTASLSLGYEKNKRKDERVLLAALTNNDFFAPWLKAFADADAALAGIHSLPLLVPNLLRKLKLADERCLVLTVQDQSLRQTFLERGEVRFSRLSPLNDSSIGGMAQTFASESVKLQQYLVSQRIIGRHEQLAAYIVAHSGALKAIQASCVNGPALRYQVLAIEDCARQTGLKTVPANSHGEPLFLHLLVSAPPRIQFADDRRRHRYHLGQVRAALHACGALALAGCLLYSGKLAFDAYGIAQETEQLAIEATQLRQRYEAIVRTFPPMPTDNESLRRVIDRYAELDRLSTSPSGLYHEISRALAAAPAAELEAIDWRVGNADAGKPPPPGQSAPTGLPALPVGSEAAVVRGTLKLGPNANARQMLAVFNQFLQALEANAQLKVDVLQRPFDIEPGKALKGGDLTLEDNQPRAFALQVTRRIGS